MLQIKIQPHKYNISFAHSMSAAFCDRNSNIFCLLLFETKNAMEHQWRTKTHYRKWSKINYSALFIWWWSQGHFGHLENKMRLITNTDCPRGPHLKTEKKVYNPPRLQGIRSKPSKNWPWWQKNFVTSKWDPRCIREAASPLVAAKFCHPNGATSAPTEL